MAAKIIYDDILEWPNGEGYTVCSQEYAAICDAMDALKPNDVNLDDLPPDDYNKFCELEHKRGVLQLNGHLGKGVRY